MNHKWIVGIVMLVMLVSSALAINDTTVGSTTITGYPAGFVDSNGFVWHLATYSPSIFEIYDSTGDFSTPDYNLTLQTPANGKYIYFGENSQWILYHGNWNMTFINKTTYQIDHTLSTYSATYGAFMGEGFVVNDQYAYSYDFNAEIKQLDLSSGIQVGNNELDTTAMDGLGSYATGIAYDVARNAIWVTAENGANTQGYVIGLNATNVSDILSVTNASVSFCGQGLQIAQDSQYVYYWDDCDWPGDTNIYKMDKDTLTESILVDYTTIPGAIQTYPPPGYIYAGANGDPTGIMLFLPQGTLPMIVQVIVVDSDGNLKDGPTNVSWVTTGGDNNVRISSNPIDRGFYVTGGNSSYITYDFPPASDPFNITACADLTASGNYTVYSDIVTSAAYCINISADNVNLDCQDNWLNSTSSGSLIYSTTSNANLTVENCNVYGGTVSLNLNSGTVTNNLFSGVASFTTAGSTIIYNNYFGSTIGVDGSGATMYVSPTSGTRVNGLSGQIGGNWYNAYSPSCADVSPWDGFCDSSYTVPGTAGAVDSYPYSAHDPADAPVLTLLDSCPTTYPNEDDAPTVAAMPLNFSVAFPAGFDSPSGDISLNGGVGNCTQNQVNSTYAEYYCLMDIHYFLPYDTYVANYTFSDYSGTWDEQQACTVGKLLASQRTVDTVTFSNAGPNIANSPSDDPMTIRNTGNAPFNISITAYNMYGQSNPSAVLYATDFKAGINLTTSVQMNNSISIELDAELAVGEGASNDIWFWLSMSADQIIDTYRSTQPWEVTASG